MTKLLLRRWHTYIGVFIAPSVLFFAVTGVFQVFSLHEAHADYQPPPVLAKLGMLHKKQVYALPRKGGRPKAEGRGEPGAAGAPDQARRGSEAGAPRRARARRPRRAAAAADPALHRTPQVVLRPGLGGTRALDDPGRLDRPDPHPPEAARLGPADRRRRDAADPAGLLSRDEAP